MSQPSFNPKRRRLIRCTLVGALGAPLLSLVRPAPAQDKISPEDPVAKSLGYTHKSQQTNKSCANCSFYQGKDAEWGPCVVLSGKSVAAAGHCTAWAAR